MIDLDNYTTEEIKEILKRIIYSELSDEDCVAVIAEWAAQTDIDIERFREG